MNPAISAENTNRIKTELLQLLYSRDPLFYCKILRGPFLIYLRTSVFIFSIQNKGADFILVYFRFQFQLKERTLLVKIDFYEVYIFVFLSTLGTTVPKS